MGNCTDLVSKAELQTLQKEASATKAELVKVGALGVTTWAATLGFKDELASAFAQGKQNLNEIKNARAAADAAKQVAYDANRQALIAKGQAIANGQAAFTNQALLQNAQATADDALKAANAAAAAATSLAARLAALLASAAITLASFALTQGQLRATQARIDAQERALDAYNADYTRLINLISQNRIAIEANNAAIEANNAIVRNNQAAISANNSRILAAESTNRDLATSLNEANARINSLISELNAVNSKASTATSIAVATSNKLPPVPVIKDLSQIQNLSAENSRLRRQLELQQSDLNGYRVALNNFADRLPTQEDKFITRKVREQTVTNASGIRDLNGQFIGIPSKIGQTVKSEFSTSIQTFKQDTQKQVSQAIANINFPEFDISKVSKAFDAKIAKITTDFNERLHSEVSAIPKVQPTEVKQIVKTEVNSQIQEITKVNNQQATEINSKLDNLNSKFPDPLTLAGIATAVGGLDILRQIKNKPIPSPICLAPALVPPVGAGVAKANVAIGTMQGLTLAQGAGIKAVVTKNFGILSHTKYGLESVQKFADIAWKATHADKAINALTLAASLHNAAMLSRNLGETLGDLTSQALSTIGVKNSEGNPLNINAAIGKSFNALMINLLGAEVYAGAKETWLRSSRIISSASQIVWTVRSIADSAREVTEWTAENTGKIGNALKKFRVVGEDAYKWMPEKVTATNKWLSKVDKLKEGVDSLDDAASSFSSVLGEVQNIQSEANELKEQGDKFKENIELIQPNEREDNKPVKDARNLQLESSKAPINQSDVDRREGETED